MPARDRILVVGGEDSAREIFIAELRGAGYTADGRSGILKDAEDADLVLVVGGATGSRRDGFSAVVDAIGAARQVAGPIGLVACVPRTAGADAVEASLASGADDVLICPPEAGVLLARVRSGLRLGGMHAAVGRFQRYADALVAVSDVVTVSLDAPETLHDLLGRISDAAGWGRTALVLNGEDPNLVILVAASDDPSTMKVPLTLDRYPEVRACLESGEPVLVEDTAHSALLGEWAELAAEKGGRALLAVPLLLSRKPVGALVLRGHRENVPLEPRVIDFLRVAAAQLALVLRTARVFEALREQTRRVPLVRYAEERRSRALSQYMDYFEAATDGILVVGGDGKVLYVNRAAQQMTGYARDGLAGRLLTEIVAAPQREALLGVVQQVVAGANLEWFDLQIMTTSGELLVVSVASSSVLAEHSAAILAFRDVTVARALEAELRNTKEFLERLIDSTVDGIIAADLTGKVMIFNQGASRLYGYSPEEVIEKVPVWKLYPDGAARGVMTELRAPEPGGVGRLPPSRREILTKDGERVPVLLTASIIYEEGREVASVGIVSDLRERLKIEHRLQQAQEQLVESEKQALIAELAGTAAHELNQPLTSVMGYSELLKKKMSPHDVHYRAVDIILREAERMAEIVRKIGRITRYETKAYVGSTQILDLDKSTTDG